MIAKQAAGVGYEDRWSARGWKPRLRSGIDAASSRGPNVTPYPGHLLSSFHSGRRTALRSAVVALVLSFAVGCGSGGVPVSGEVFEDGKPAEVGFVQFSPDSEQGTNGPAVIMDIKDGKFTSASERVPVVPGHHRVRIVVQTPGPEPEAVPREYAVKALVPPAGVTDLKFEVVNKAARGASRRR